MPTALRHPLDPPVFATRPDIRLIAADMDGTLLDDDGDLPADLLPLVRELARRRIVFCPASGRQYFNLLERFEEFADEMVFIAENGTYVVRRGREISSDCLTTGAVTGLVAAARALGRTGADLGAVICGKRSAYVERRDPRFLAQVEKYFSRLSVVDDLLRLPDDDVLKVAVFDFGSAEATTAPAFAPFLDHHRVVVSGQHWVDIMNRSANKGEGVRGLQQELGITPAQTMVFGDFLNDLEMMDAAEFSFAMDNAHPLLRARARYVAPPNSENGVVRTITAVLGLTDLSGQATRPGRLSLHSTDRGATLRACTSAKP
ncbi:Cof-type HAD-IIB family hydrolase [Pengzhenrongella frigida]|uniref:Cof-type HAD-IIB family hydrolase n=1 Tax=Pengzhenrongella frigida TaxID=1259133 RepID=UPI001F5D8060|nr:Cof-type HAD-IIB family hydrolase [Cellulomonas sp. HLT2-17]